MGFGESLLLFTRRQQVPVCLPLPAPVVPAPAASKQEQAGPGQLPGVSLLRALAEVSGETLWRLVLKQLVLLPQRSYGGSGASSQQRFCPLAALPRVTWKTLLPPLSHSSGALLCSSSAEVCSSRLLVYEGCPQVF